MDYQNQALHHGQSLGEKGIEDDRKRYNRNDKERAVPAFENVSRVIKDQQALNKGPGNECD